MSNPLQSKAVLAAVTIRRWTGRKHDAQISEEVNEQHGAEADASRTNKLLISKVAFARVHSATKTARRAHHVMTQPWFDEGPRVLPTALYDKFSEKIRELRTEFDDAADEFNTQYPSYVKSAKKRMNSMFKAEDYPDAGRVRGMFSFNVAILPFPDVTDFRVKLSSEQLEDSERQLKEALENAMKDPIRRIIKVVDKMTTRLKLYQPATDENIAEHTFRDTLVGNVRELVDLLPAFNLTNDPKLAELTRRMEKELCANDAEVLREDDTVRAKVAKAAEEILKKANALMA